MTAICSGDAYVQDAPPHFEPRKWGNLPQIIGGQIYTPILREGVPHKHLEASLVKMYFPSFSLENKFLLVHTKPLLCLLRNLSFQS